MWVKEEIRDVYATIMCLPFLLAIQLARLIIGENG